VTVGVDVGAEDFLEVQSRALLRRLLIVVGLLLFLWLPLQWSPCGAQSTTIVVVAVAAFGIIYVVLRRRVGYVTRKQFASLRSSLTNFSLSTDFVTVRFTSSETSGFHTVSSLLRVNRYKSLIGLQMSPKHQYVVPIRCFASLADAANFERRLRSAVKSQKAATKARTREGETQNLA